MVKKATVLPPASPENGPLEKPVPKKTGRKEKAGSTKPVKDSLHWVGIGASAGGLEALREVLKTLPKPENDITYIIAQHLSPKHQSMLVQLLGRETTMPVEEVRNGIVPEPGVIYITPPNSDVFVREGELHLRKPPSELSPKPSVDFFFATLAQEIGDHAIGVILSGTGSDGSHGVRAIRAEGGLTIAQDPEEAKYDGMPANSINTGCIDLVLPAERIGEQILSIIRTPTNLKLLQEEEITRSTMHELLHLLKERSAVDFRDYKSGTLYRRINRRMTACAAVDLDDYLAYVKNNPLELDLLFRDIMISVTNFFRDKEAFNSLKSLVKKMLSDKIPGSDIRVWIPGCATGEEAYSIVILFAEAAGGIRQLQQKYNFQLFATDIDTDALSIGRKGTYPETTFEGMGADIRDKYFRHKEEKGYEVVKSVRDLVMFSRHNVFNDPPFLRLDLISCRNLLIYFNAKLQATVMNLFHYALNPNGILFLGKSEALGSSTTLFQPIDNRAKIYQRKLVSSYEAIRSAKASYSTVSRNATPAPPQAQTKTSHDFPDAVIGALSPDSLLIDENMNILRVYGDVHAYTQLSPGEASINLLSIARKEFRQELRALVYKVLRENGEPSILPKKLSIGGVLQRVNICIRPLILKNSSERMLLVSFEKVWTPGEVIEESDSRSRDDPLLMELEQELAATKEHLQTVVEELETSNEELQSTNEEMQSTNEELQSSNEEMETANEELQSTNEELLTVNEELQIKSAELASSTEDLENIKESIDIPLIVVENSLRVTRFNKAAHRIFLLGDGSEGEAITSLGTRIDIPDLRQRILRVIETGVAEERQLNARDFSHLERILPYRDGDGSVNGAVLSYIENTREQMALEELRRSEERYKLATEGSQAGMWDWDIAENKMHWSELLLRMMGIRDEGFTPSLNEFKARIHEDDRRDIMDILQAHLDRGFEFDVEFRMRRESGTYFWANASGQALWNERREPQRMTGFIYDVTERRQTLEHLSRTNESLERFAYVCSHDLKEPARSVENFAALVLEDYEDKLDDAGRKYLQYIHECAQQMQQMIKGILNYSQLESKNIALEEINLEDEIAKVLDNLKFSVDESRATITHDILPIIRADRMQVFQLFQNLIGNSLKFCKDRKPRVHIAVETTPNEFVFAVKDNGIGIRPEHTQKIFNVFQRLNGKEEYPGTGVGLSICQKVVTRHGGRIWVESELGKGSTFYFTFPNQSARSMNYGNKITREPASR